MSRLTRGGTAEPVSRDQIIRHARGQGNIHFPCSADHEQDWQPYPVDPFSAICDDHTCCTNDRHLMLQYNNSTDSIIQYRSSYNNMFVRLGTDYEIRNGGYFESIKNSANQFISKP